MATISALNAIVIDQQKQIDSLTKLVNNLVVDAKYKVFSVPTEQLAHPQYYCPEVHEESYNDLKKITDSATAAVKAHMQTILELPYLVAHTRNYLRWHLTTFGCAPEDLEKQKQKEQKEQEERVALAQQTREDESAALAALVRAGVEAEEALEHMAAGCE